MYRVLPMNEPLPGRLAAAAEHFNKQFLPRFATVRDIKPETIIVGTARMAGTMLYRSFAASDEARLKGPKLLDILFETLREMGHDIGDQSLDNKDVSTAASQLWLRESQALLDPVVLGYCQAAGLSPEEAAHALAVAAALFVHDCASMLDVRKGAAIAAAGFAEGCKTAPPPKRQ